MSDSWEPWLLENPRIVSGSQSKRGFIVACLKLLPQKHFRIWALSALEATKVAGACPGVLQVQRALAAQGWLVGCLLRTHRLCRAAQPWDLEQGKCMQVSGLKNRLLEVQGICIVLHTRYPMGNISESKLEIIQPPHQGGAGQAG